jgi:hypothetical protein
VTLLFRTLHAFVIVQHKSRRTVHVGVTDHPRDAWITQQARDATSFEEKPKYLICDNDKQSSKLHFACSLAARGGCQGVHGAGGTSGDK